MGDSTTSRPAPTASGTLAKTPLLHLLVYAFDRRLGGTIELVAPDRRNAAVLFVEGRPAKVRTSEPVAHLGRVLLELGHLTEADLTQSLAELAKAKATGPMLHGTRRVARGTIDTSKLKAALIEQTARKLRHVAAMPAETIYAYYDAFDALRGWGGEGEPVDPVPLLWGMLLEYPPWERVSAALATISASQLRLAPGADLERLGLHKDERTAAELLRSRPLRASELPRVGRLNDRTAQLLAYLLLVTRQVEVLAPPQAAATPSVGPAGSPSAAPPATAAAAASPRPVVTPSPRPAVTPSPRPAVTPSGRPAATPSARPAARPSDQPAATSMPPSSGAPTRTRSPQPAAPSSPPEPPPSLAPELVERWREIVERSATIDRADYFIMLDLARDATREDIEAAFFALVKRWHPDRLPPELAPVREACSRVFARMSEAHATLTSDDKRAQYMRLLADGSGSPETQATLARVVDAATSFQ